MPVVLAALVGRAGLGACGGDSPEVTTAPGKGGREAPAERAPRSCAATRVERGVVRAGPFTGHIAPQYDVLDGRFPLRVGRVRDPATGLTQKIPWFVEPGARVGESLGVTGERIDRSPRAFRQTFRGTTDSTGQRVFPSVIAPPAEGCWRLRFTSGKLRADLVVCVTAVDQPSADARSAR